MAHSKEIKKEAIGMLVQGYSVTHISNTLGVPDRTVRN